MSVTPRIAAAAMLAGLAVGTTSTAWAAPTMSGHYIETATNSDGQSVTNDWYFTPCGDGCASLATAPGGQASGHAQLANGQWTIDVPMTAHCRDGTVVPSGDQAHFVWDANTLAGTDAATYKPGVCPADARTATYNLQLRQADGSSSNKAPEK
jgi:hypothetical protein